VEKMMDALKKFASDHPQITSWIVLAIGMVIILIWSASDVGFTPGQWTALVITTILLAGACVWIIGWEDDEEEAEALVEPVKAEAEPEAKES
jgi:hypothetical protein